MPRRTDELQEKVLRITLRGLREFIANMVDWCTKKYFGKRSGYVLDKAKFEELKRKNREKGYPR